MAYKAYWTIENWKPRFPEKQPVLSYSFGHTSPQALGVGRDGFRTEFKDFIVTRQMDKYSALFSSAAISGTHLGSIVLLITTGTGKSLHTVVKYTFENCIVAGYVPGSSTGGELPTEAVTINYLSAKIEMSKQ